MNCRHIVELKFMWKMVIRSKETTYKQITSTLEKKFTYLLWIRNLWNHDPFWIRYSGEFQAGKVWLLRRLSLETCSRCSRPPSLDSLYNSCLWKVRKNWVQLPTQKLAPYWRDISSTFLKYNHPNIVSNSPFSGNLNRLSAGMRINIDDELIQHWTV